MRITSAKFVKSAFKKTDWPRDQRPEIAFLGRSNVGKSSFLNSLLGVRGLARISSTPGRTQALNFFLINDAFWFVDLPGYGYARAPRDVQAKWSDAAGEYLEKSDQLALSVHLIDSRHEPTTKDLQLHDWLIHHQRSHVIVATKADKLSSNEVAKNVARAQKVLKTSNVIAYSSVTGRGANEVWRAITDAIKKLNPKEPQAQFC